MPMNKTPRGSGTSRIRIHPSRQLTQGFHGTLSDMQPGDVIRPADERGALGTTATTDTSTTYFAPQADFAWHFVNSFNKPGSAKAFGKPDINGTGYAWPDRPRVLTTEPTPDQTFDSNFLRKQIEENSRSNKFWRSKTPVRSLINAAREETPRTASSQLVTGVEFSPVPKQGEFVEQTFTPINWRQFGGENYKVHDRWGVTRTDENGKILLPNDTPSEKPRKELEGQLSLDGVNGVKFPEREFEEDDGLPKYG